QEHILSLRPTELTVDLLEERLAAPEKSILAVELPRWGDMLRQNVAIFDLDFDAILAAIYAVSDSAEGDCYLSVPPDPGIGAAALGASESAAPGTSESAAPSAGESATPGTGKSALSGALHTFTLDSGASRSFFRDSTTLTPLSRPVAVSMADPSGGPVLAHSSTVLPCPAAPSGLLSGLHLPSFSMNLVSGADLQDAWVDQFTPGGLVLSLPPCSCRPLSHETLRWHHRLGHPSLPRRRGMASRTLVSGLPRSLPPLPPRPAPTRVPCVKGRQRAAPHSSTFPPTEALVQTLHMDVCGPARVSGQGHERYFLLVVDDYSRYTTVFPLRSKGEVTETEVRRIGMVMDVARTSMINAAAPHFLWPFAVQYAAHQINLQPRVSLPETAPTLRWTGKVGDASVFRVWGSQAFFRDTSADKLSSRAVPCVFLGFPPDAPGWQFYHPTLRRVLSSQDVTFDESVSYYRTPPVDPLPPHGPAPSGVSQVDPAEPVELAVDSGAARGAEPAGAGTGGVEPGVSVSEGAEPGGAESGSAEPGGAEPGPVELGGAESGSAEPRGAGPERAASGGPPGVPSRREPLSPQQLREWYVRRCQGVAGAAGAGGAAGGAAGAGAAGGGSGAAGGAARAAGGATSAGAAGGASGAAGGAGAAGPEGARTGGIGAAGAGGAVAVGAVGAGAVATVGTSGAGAGGGTQASGTAGVVAGDRGAEGTGAVAAVSGGLRGRGRTTFRSFSRFLLQPTSPLPGPSPYSGLTRGLTERREPESRPVSPESRSALPVRTVRASRRVSRPRPPLVPGTHSMTLRPSTAPQRVPLLSPPASSLPDGPDPKSDSLRAASPTVTRFLATAVTDPWLESTATYTLETELADFAAACRLDFATSLVA
ncbi:unnamed protein product, partial [Closterium sp. NIES-53]